MAVCLVRYMCGCVPGEVHVLRQCSAVNPADIPYSGYFSGGG